MDGVKAWLYTIGYDDKMAVQEGHFYPGTHKWSKQGRFEPSKGSGWCFVANQPKEIYYRKLWLTERDDELAKELYIKYHERKIESLEKNIETHKYYISVLKGEK
jgi:hypothetical protein